MDLYDSRVLAEVIAKIDAESQSLNNALVDSPAIDFGGYQRRVGHIKGLGHAILIIEQVKDEFGQKDKAKPMPDHRSYED